MKLYDVADLAIRNLRESVFRNSLTTIGISVGAVSYTHLGCESPSVGYQCR